MALDKVLLEMKDDDLLKKDLKELQKALKIFEYHKHKRYRLYFRLAKELKEKGYLLQAVALIAEAKGYYVKSSMKSVSSKVRNYFEVIEKKIEDKESFDNYSKYTYYQLNQECKTIYSTNLNKILTNNSFFQKKFKYIRDKDVIKEIKNNITYNHNFKNFIWYDLRNQLVHANSIENIGNVKGEIDKEIIEFEKYCIEDNILNCSE